MYNTDLFRQAKKDTPSGVIRQIEELSVTLSLQWPMTGEYQYMETLRDLTSSPEVGRLSELLRELPKQLWPASDKDGRFIREDVLVWAHLLASQFVPRPIRRIA